VTRYLVVLALAAGLARSAGAFPQESPKPTPGPSPGETIPAFDAESLDGTVKHIDFPKGSTTVLLFFLSSCPHCQKMIPLWNDAYDKRAPSLSVFGVLLDRETPGFFSLVHVAFPVVRAPSPAFAGALKVRTVPVTLRVGPGGKIDDSVVGSVDPIRLGEFFRR
jgi:thiol-disulfide isomerase/thioredoxin